MDHLKKKTLMRSWIVWSPMIVLSLVALIVTGCGDDKGGGGTNASSPDSSDSYRGSYRDCQRAHYDHQRDRWMYDGDTIDCPHLNRYMRRSFHNNNYNYRMVSTYRACRQFSNTPHPIKMGGTFFCVSATFLEQRGYSPSANVKYWVLYQPGYSGFHYGGGGFGSGHHGGHYRYNDDHCLRKAALSGAAGGGLADRSLEGVVAGGFGGFLLGAFLCD